MPWLDDLPTVPEATGGEPAPEAPAAVATAPARRGGRFLDGGKWLDEPPGQQKPQVFVEHPDLTAPAPMQLETPEEFKTVLNPAPVFTHFATAPLIPLSRAMPSAQQVSDAIDALIAATPGLTREEAADIINTHGLPGTPSKAIAGALGGLGKAAEGLTTLPNIALLGTSALPSAIGRVVSGLFTADMARQFPEQYRQLRQAVDSGDPEAIARSATDLATTAGFVAGAGKHALVGHGAPPELETTLKTPPQEPAAVPPAEAPANTSEAALKELEAALRSNQIPTRQKPVAQETENERIQRELHQPANEGGRGELEPTGRQEGAPNAPAPPTIAPEPGTPGPERTAAPGARGYEEARGEAPLSEDELDQLARQLVDLRAQRGLLPGQGATLAARELGLPVEDARRVVARADQIEAPEPLEAAPPPTPEQTKAGLENLFGARPAPPTPEATARSEIVRAPAEPTAATAAPAAPAPTPPDAFESALDRLKADTGPDQIHAFGLIPELWNGLIEVVRLAYRAGRSVKDAVSDGFDWLRRSHPDVVFDREAAGTYLEGALERHGAQLLPETPHGITPERMEEIAGETRELRDRIRALRAAGEAVPQDLSDRLFEREQLLGEAVGAGRRPRGGIPRAARAVETEGTGVPRGTEETGTTEGTAGTATTAIPGATVPPGAPAPPVPPFRGAERLPRAGGLPEAWNALQNARDRLLSWFAGRDVRGKISYLRDAAENRAKLFGHQAGNVVRLALNRAFGEAPHRVTRGNDLREYALTFAVEADRDPNNLRLFHQMISGSRAADTVWGKRALRAIEFANDNWERLAPVVEVYRRISEAEREIENQAGVNTLQWPGGYVMHMLAGEDLEGGPGAAPGRPVSAAQPFRHIRDFPTYAEIIAAGRRPRTLNAVDLLAHRTTAGQRVINEMAWLWSLRQLHDPRSGQPVATDPVYRTRADGTEDVTAPAGYSVVRVGPAEFALQNGYVGAFNDLTSPSWWRASGPRAAVQKAFTFGKQMVLMGDTFHLGRLAFWRSVLGTHHGVIPGLPGFRKGATLLDYTVADIREMAARGEIPPAWATGLEENHTKLQLALETGFNVGSVPDNLYADWIQHIPGLGTFNRWLFGQYQRGAMAESWLIEFERLRKAMPAASDEEVARRVSVDLNTRFGNLGSQGLFRSKTGQDLARLVFLAPQWNESLIRSEVGTLVQLGRLPFDSAVQRRLVVGSLLRATGTMLVGQFIANQLINYATRGKPTWENPEEGFGAKISAWIPDVVGKGPGFFLNPMSIAAEITHLVERKLERSQGVSDAALQILNSRLTGPARAADIFITRRDALGRSLREGDVLPTMAKALIPLPISGGAIGSAAKQLATGQNEERFAGQYQKQLLSTFGVKTDQAPNPEQRVRGLAQEFNQQKGIVPSAEFFSGDYYDLTEALRRGNADDARTALDDLLGKKTRAQIIAHYERWISAPYTGKTSREGEFLRGLSPEQRQQYVASRERRRQIAKEALDLLRSMPRSAPVGR